MAHFLTFLQSLGACVALALVAFVVVVVAFAGLAYLEASVDDRRVER
ncbi:hypothetical protein [Variovorax sp.]